MARWELRRCLRYGSQHIRYTGSEEMARSHANGDIVANGNVGYIRFVDQEKRILYYDVYPDDE